MTSEKPENAQPPLLIALNNHIEPQTYLIERDICTLGRSEICNIVVPGRTISRIHSTIQRHGPRYVLKDAGSANGTYINGRLLHQEHLLKHGDMFGLGQTVAHFRFDDPDSTLKLSGLLRFDTASLTFYLDKTPLPLSPTELRLLRHLYQYQGQVCTRGSCIAAVWQDDPDDSYSDSLDRTISNLRRKINQVDAEADFIKTRRGFGYVLEL
jgi:DNA-binding response OmpR family regulator